MATRLDYFYVQLRGRIAGLGLNENNQGQSHDAVGPYLAGGQYATPDIQLVVHYFCGFGEECASHDHPSNVQEAVKNQDGRWRGTVWPADPDPHEELAASGAAIRQREC
jgi:hypothetical protein